MAEKITFKVMDDNLRVIEELQSFKFEYSSKNKVERLSREDLRMLLTCVNWHVKQSKPQWSDAKTVSIWLTAFDKCLKTLSSFEAEYSESNEIMIPAFVRLSFREAILRQGQTLDKETVESLLVHQMSIDNYGSAPIILDDFVEEFFYKVAKCSFEKSVDYYGTLEDRIRSQTGMPISDLERSAPEVLDNLKQMKVLFSKTQIVNARSKFAYSSNSLMVTVMMLMIALSGVKADICLVSPVVDSCGYRVCTGFYDNAVGTTLYDYESNCTIFPKGVRKTQVAIPGNTTGICYDQAGEPDDSCVSFCTSNGTHTGCCGTSSFCAIYGCVDSVVCRCNCQMVSFDTWTQVLVADIWRNVSDIRPAVIAFERITQQQRNVRTSPNFCTVAISSNNAIIVSTSGTFSSRILFVHKGDDKNIYPFTTTEFTQDIEDKYFITSGNLQVEVILDGITMCKTTKEIVGSSMCRVSDCTMCWDAWNNLNCLPTGTKVTLIIFFIFLGLLALCFLPIILMALLYIAKFIGFVMRMLWRLFFVDIWNWARPKFANSFNKAKDRIRKAAIDPATGEELLPVTTSMSRRGGGRLSGFYSTAVMISVICCIIPISEAYCSDGALIPALTTTCTAGNATVDDCQFTTQLLATIPDVGGSSCFTLTDNTGKLLASIKIKFFSMKQTVSISNLYTTSAWYGLSEGIQRCRNAGSCTGVQCETMASTNRNAYGKLNGALEGYPGAARCDAGCGCAGCGCFYCSSSCLFSGYGLIATGANCAVRAPLSSVYTPMIQVEVIDTTGVTVVQNATLTSSPITIGSFSFTIVGTFNNGAAIFGSRKAMICSNGQNYLGFASEVNAPVAGSIGDIQSNNAAQLFSNSITAFIYAPGLFTFSGGGGTSVSYSFRNPGFDALSVQPKLPTTFGNSVWNYVSGNLESDLLSIGTMVVQVNTVGTGYTIQRRVELVCPEASFISMDGCFSCDSGAAIKISAKSLCFGGLVSISDDDTDVIISTSSIVITNTTSTYTIFAKSPHTDVEMNLLISGNGGTVSVSVSGKLIDANLVINQTQGSQQVSGAGKYDTSCFTCFFNSIPDGTQGFFERIFNGTAKWYEYLIFVLLIIAAIILMVLLLPALIRLFRFIGSQITQSVRRMRLSKIKEEKLN